MTTFLLILTLALIPYLYNLRHLVRDDHPRSIPQSHPDWTGGGLPSRPYAAR